MKDPILPHIFGEPAIYKSVRGPTLVKLQFKILEEPSLGIWFVPNAISPYPR